MSYLLRNRLPAVSSILFFAIAASVLPPERALAQRQTSSGTQKPPASSKTSSTIRPTDETLIEALEKEDSARALLLINQGANPNAHNANGSETALSLAAGLGNLKLVQALVARGAIINPTEAESGIPLIAALAAGYPDVAQFLLEKGAAVNVGAGDAFMRRPLVLAAANGWMPLVTQLVAKGAEVNHAADDGITALSAAAENGQLKVIEFLIAHGANLAGDSQVMQQAVVGGDVPTVQYLIAHGRSLQEPVKEMTMMHLAAQSGKPQMLQLVLDAGADLNAIDKDGETPLMIAVQNRRIDSVGFLLSKKAPLDTLSPRYQTALDLTEEPVGLFREDEKAKAEITAALRKAGAKPAPPSLWRAAIQNDLPQLKSLLEKGADPNEPDARHGVPLYYALSEHLSSEAVPLIQTLLEHGANPNTTAPDGRTLVDAARDEADEQTIALLRRAGAETPELDLTEAIEREDMVTVDKLLARGTVPESAALVLSMSRKDDHALMKRLLEKGAKVNAPTRMHGFLFFGAPDFALHAAAMIGDVTAVRLLLDHGADPNLRKSADDATPLHQVGGDNLDNIDAIVHLLVERGADIRDHATGLGEGSVLSRLAGVAPPRTLEFVMSKGAAADINVAPGNTKDISPLTMAVRHENVENVRLLLERGANPDPIERFGKMTPLMEVAWDKETPQRTAIAKLLLEHGARVDAQDEEGRNPLRLAQETGNIGVANLIRAAGVTKATVAPAFEMAQAIYQDDRAVAARLLKDGFDPNGRLAGGDTPLYEAARSGAEDIVHLLLERGADVNVSSQLGTPLHAAADHGDPDLVRLLLARGAKVDAEDNFSGTPLARAAEEGHTEVMRILLKAGADPNARHSQHPGSPLSGALKKGGDEALDILLKAGADPNLGNVRTIILLFGDLSKLQKLVRAGANINAADEQGRTLLMEAAGLGLKEIVAWLIEHKADVNHKDKQGRTALMEAQEREKTECARLLRKAGAR